MSVVSFKLLGAAALALVLAGCSKGPSSADVEALIRAESENITQQMEALGGAFGGDLARAITPEVHSVHVIGCEEVRHNVYRCDLEIDATRPMIGRKSEVTQMEFVRLKDGRWSILN